MELILLFSLLIIGCSCSHTIDHSEESTCLNAYHLVEDIQEEKDQVVETIRNLLPFDLPDRPDRLNGSESSSRTAQVYEQLAELFEESPSTEGYNGFIAAVDEIYTAYTTECGKGSSEIAESEIASLAAAFSEVTTQLKRFHKDPVVVTEAREIYSKFLCLQEQETGRRRKRQNDPISLTPTVCDCPELVTVPCHFFACLEVTVTKFIMGFGVIEIGFPCVAFVIDTTGSMRDEIAAARNIILQFVKSQADTTACYMLVPFNDYDWDFHYYDNVGPITYAFTTETHELGILEDQINSLTAHGGGDDAEYAFSAMYDALNYKVDGFHLLDYHSEMIVITDHTSKLPELRETVIHTAKRNEVAIHFILSDGAKSFYEDIANETGGIIYDESYTSWSILEFYDQLDASGAIAERKRRSTSSEPVTINISRFVYALRVSILTGTSSGTVNITLPDGSTDSATIEDSVMIYLKKNPQPGHYVFSIGAVVEDVLIHQDVSLDVSLLYLDNNSTVSSTSPPSACTTGKLALATSRSLEISTLTLKETDSSGSSRLIPLTKCSNAFTCDYQFEAGNYSYQIQGTDSDGIFFTYDLGRSITVNPSSSDTYSLRPSDDTIATVEYSSLFHISFELQSNEDIGSTNFTLEVDADGFILSLDKLNVLLSPRQTQIVTLTGYACSSTIPEGSTHALTITGNNGCETLTATKMITVTRNNSVFHPLNSTVMTIERNGNITMEFELFSDKNYSNPVFVLSVHAVGFITYLNQSSITLLPNQPHVISLWGVVGSSTIGGGNTYKITVTASNECVTLSTSRMITVKPLATVPPSALPTNECGCLNGGTCIIVSRRGRTSRRCTCTPEFFGSRCQISK